MSSTAIATQPSNAKFVTTHWSIVLAAADGEDPAAREALANFCQTYWYPLYAYARRRGYPPAESQDLTQEFFARLLERGTLAGISREGGKFRSFLLTLFNHFLVDEWKRAKALKRGCCRIVSLDATTAETRFRHEPVETETAETIFERNWALALLQQVYEKLKRQYEAAGQGTIFEELKFCLMGERSTLPYAELSATLNVSEAALKVAVHRLRQRYRELLRAEVANTVSTPAEIDEELRELFRILAR